MATAKAFRTGELIGYVGYTGLKSGGGESPSDLSNLSPSAPPSWSTWDPHGAHLHFQVFRRKPDGSKEAFDPFGIDGDRDAYGDVFKVARGLILPKSNGSPIYARE